MMKEMTITRTDSNNADFLALVQNLDRYLAEVDGSEHAFYHQFNKVDKLNNVVVGYVDEKAVACGAFKPLSDFEVEIKRMWTEPGLRHKGVASKILKNLEEWAAELGFDIVVLETGKRMPAAVGLYTRHGYILTENYGQYIGVENSVCFKKSLK